MRPLPPVLVLSLLAASPTLAADPFEDETRAWHAQRISRLTTEDGWLSLVGLHWLEEGPNTVGSAPDARVRLPESAPAEVGTLVLRQGQVTLRPARGVALRKDGQPFTGGALRDDAEGKPDLLELGSLRFHVLRRGEKVGIRVRDPRSPARVGFEGIKTFPPAAKWRLQARFVPFETPRKIPIPTVLGTVEPTTSTGEVAFEVDGKAYRLQAIAEPGDESLFLVFGDWTNRDDTYGAGRFVYATVAGDGSVLLDFNRAYNPPCAFTPYATCPLPPRANRLPLRVEAGELRYGEH